MPSQKLPKYVFRGTTIDFPGGSNSREVPYTCTSRHPIKALWFALECYHNRSATAVVYVAQTNKLSDFETGRNHLHKLESEVGFFTQPINFYPLCEGFYYVPDLQRVLKEMGFDTYHVVRKDNLSRLCKETPALSAKKIELLLETMLPYLK